MWFYVHMAFMVLMVVMILSGVVIAWRRQEGWLKKHRVFAFTGVVFGLLGVSAMAYAKISAGYPHFKTTHAIGGGIALMLFVVTPILGYLVTKGSNNLRAVHRWVGRITALFIIGPLITGGEYFLEKIGLIKDDH